MPLGPSGRKCLITDGWLLSFFRWVMDIPFSCTFVKSLYSAWVICLEISLTAHVLMKIACWSFSSQPLQKLHTAVQAKQMGLDWPSCKFQWFTGFVHYFVLFHHIFNTSPSSGQIRLSRDQPIPPPVPDLHFGIEDWIRTPATRRLLSCFFAFHSRPDAPNDEEQLLRLRPYLSGFEVAVSRPR